MSRYIAFLRAINVGGHVVKMEALRGLFESLRFSRVETFIASGNVVFESRSGDTRALAKRIERLLHTSLGYEVATFIRTDAQVAAIAEHRFWESAKARSATARNVGFLSQPPRAEAKRALMKLSTDTDDFCVDGRELYWLSRAMLSASDFSYALFEKTLKVQATFRGLTTVRRLAAKYATSH
ncbi:MAG: DUF1697 domain-containing protein, partial [Gemmatimonadales bacterium]